jgi:hypothetical protein
MCPHDKFDILFYGDGVLVRKCRNCGQVEVKTERWVSALSTIDLIDSNGEVWASVSFEPPVGEDFLCYRRSVDVLFTDGKSVYAGYCKTWDDEEGRKPEWMLGGPDGYEFDGEVLGWRLMPEVPVRFTELRPAGETEEL